MLFKNVVQNVVQGKQSMASFTLQLLRHKHDRSLNAKTPYVDVLCHASV